MPPLPQAFNLVAEQIPANSLILLWNVIRMSSNGPSNQEVAWSYDFNSIFRVHVDWEERAAVEHCLNRREQMMELCKGGSAVSQCLSHFFFHPTNTGFPNPSTVGRSCGDEVPSNPFQLQV